MVIARAIPSPNQERQNLMNSAIKFRPVNEALGYRHKEIAEMLGRSLSASKSQLQKAHRHLRKLLTGDHRKIARQSH